MNTFAISTNFVAIGCQECGNLLGSIEIFSFEEDFPLVFKQTGSSKVSISNHYFGA
jgi:hypothetical protein